METICKICHTPVSLDDAPYQAGPIASEMFAHMLKSIALSVVHNRCFDEWKQRRFLADEAKILIARNAEWERLCPPAYQDTEIDRLPNPISARKVLGWEYNKRGLTLQGITGRGKTRAMWLLLSKLFVEGKFVAAVSHTEFTAKATLANWHGNQNAVSWIEMLSKADVLFIDDLGKSRFKTADGNSRAAEEVLFAILESRWTKNRPCMFTTNGTTAQFERQMSQDMAEPLMRRLREFQDTISF